MIHTLSINNTSHIKSSISDTPQSNKSYIQQSINISEKQILQDNTQSARQSLKAMREKYGV